ncbi:CHAT domain-containing protein [Mesorhizobium sp. M0751]|uniref:CHAT domain-containing protein n=1 Tax=unclassified Mesorhizobium TaxID=325217 RepID=UPI003336A71D
MTDPENPADGSFLALTKSHLTGAALRKMKLKFVQGPIVVMSACFSGLGKVFPGGVYTDFWLKAGASQVVVSLWAVSDAGTRDLMALFAAEMSKQFENGATNANGAETALALAMRGLKATERDPAV